MNFYLVPLEARRNYRAPRYVKARWYEHGLEGYWSLKDFGCNSPIGLIGTDIALRQRDVFRIQTTGAWTQKSRNDLTAYLKQAGIEGAWIAKANDWREGLHRIAGMTQVMQSANDDPYTNATLQNPSKWLGRAVLFGPARLAPLDMRLYFAEQEARRFRIRDWVIIGREWVNERLGMSMPVFAGGALPVTDAFTTASDQLLTAYSANWSMNVGQIMVIAATDDFRGNSLSAEAAGFHNVETFSNEQYSQVTTPTVGVSDWCGCAARCAAAGTATYYAWYQSDTADYSFKNVAGTTTTLGSSGGGGAAGDTLRLETQGTTIRPKRNGSVPGTPGAQTDSSIASGKAGISAWVATGVTRGDNFEGGNLPGGIVYNPGIPMMGLIGR